MQSASVTNQDKELEILEHIYSSVDEVRQRELATVVGLSLGMTNSILKRLAKKGFLTIRKVNNRNIKYIVSAKGVDAIMHRSYRYFKRTIKNVAFYRQSIETLVHRVKNLECSALVLVGVSDLDFIVEYACNKSGIQFLRDDEGFSGKIFMLYSETYISDKEIEKQTTRPNWCGVAFLQDVVGAVHV